MTDIEFVLSLTPEQIYKFVDFNKKENLLVGIILKPVNKYDTLCVRNDDFRMDYKWINNEWKEDAYI